MSRQCPEPKKERPIQADRPCFNCGEVGHQSRECTAPRKERPVGGAGRGGGGWGGGRGRGGGRGGRGRGGAARPPRSCYNCGGSGHLSSDCSEARRGSDSVSTAEDIRRKRTQLVNDITEEFQKMGISIGNPHLAPKKAPGVSGRQLRLSSNVSGLKMEKLPVYRYDLTFSATILGRGKQKDERVELTKRSKDDCVVVDRKNMSRVAFLAFVKKNPDIFGTNEKALFYDLSSILFTLAPIDLGVNNEIVLDLQSNDCTAIEELSKFSVVELLIRKIRDAFQLTIGDLSGLSNDTTQQDHSLRQFIELATSQYPLFEPSEHCIIGGGSSFLMNPEKHGFVSEDSPRLSEFKYMAIGAHKSVRYVEGPKGRGNKHVGLIVETKKTPFHAAGQNLLEKAASIVNVANDGSIRPNDIHTINTQFKTLHVDVRYKKGYSRDVRISGIVTETAASKRINVYGETVSVAEYYVRKYDMNLHYPNAPLATALERGRTNFYPVELCFVKDCQRANLQQLNPREVAAMIQACSVPPDVLRKQNLRNVDALHLRDSEWLKAAGIMVTKPLIVNGRQLAPPQIVYKTGMSPVSPENGKWMTREMFLRPAEVKKWAIYMIPAGGTEIDRRTRFDFNKLRAFTRVLTEACRRCGMTIPLPADSKPIPGTFEDVEVVFKACKAEGCDFIFFVTSDAITTLHNYIKQCEQRYSITTQDLKMSNCDEIVNKGKKETVDNIIYKTNVKLGGLNYTVSVSDPLIREMINEGTLFIGLGISHPGALSTYERARGATPSIPSVIGYAANMKKDPFDLVGDFVYDEARRDEKFRGMRDIRWRK